MASSETVASLVRQLVWSAEREQPPDVRYRRPLEQIVDLWRENPQLCREVVVGSLKWWKGFRELTDDVILAAQFIDDTGYLQVLDECSRDRKCPRDVKQELLSVLIERSVPEAVARYESNFRKLVRDIRTGRARSDVVGSSVMELCRLRLTTLLPDLEGLQRLYVEEQPDRYHFDIGTRSCIDATITWFRDGTDRLIELIRDRKTNEQHRAAYVYCLGCAQQPAFYQEFVDVYWQSQGWFSLTEVPISCVEAIVYSSSPRDVCAFLHSALERHTTSRTLKKPRWYFEAGLLLMGTYYAPSIDDRLAQVASAWLDATNKEMAATAWLALEQHGVKAETHEKLLKQWIDSRLQFIREHPSPLMLMPYRRRGSFSGRRAADGG